jgi:M6 family metalloprotease-like protein
MSAGQPSPSDPNRARRRRRILGISHVARGRSLRLVGASVLSAIAIAAAGPGLYPLPEHDFSHPGTPHAPLFSPSSGTNDRPLLIVVTMFSDQNQAAETARETIDANFFGPRSVTDYFRASSFGKLTFSRAAETSDVGNDGIVHVNMSPTYESWFGTLEATRHQQLLQAADPSVNFAVFDRNGDNSITDDELTIVEVQEVDPDKYQCGGTRPIATPTVLDGKTLGGVKNVSFGGSSTNKITHVHEILHQALGTRDNGYVSGRLDVMGATCGAPGFAIDLDVFWETNAWNKLHFGWATPTVVTADGFYSVDRWDESGESFLLYDPDRGTNDYFLVENRTATDKSYDEDASDAGLVIWRVDDTRFGQDIPLGPYQLIRPGMTSGTDVPGQNYMSSFQDAWDPDDFSTLQRTMIQPWTDGTASNVAVRAIGGAGNRIRAYFDVRGPGILVDPSPAATEVTMLTPEAISFPVLNTGEVSDSFSFTFTNLAAGWSATTDTQTLPPCSGVTGSSCAPGTATVQLTVPANAPTGLHSINATGRSTSNPSITSSAMVTVKVVKRGTTLAYTGEITADYSDPAVGSAVLTDTETGQPLVGRAVDITIGTQSTDPDPLTDGAGTATGSITIDQPSGSVDVTASFGGDGTYLASSNTSAFAITKETLSFGYTGSTLVQLGTTPTLSAVATEESDGSTGDLTKAGAAFSLVPTLTTTVFGYETAVSATGVASTSATGLPVDIWSVAVAVPTSNAYWTGSTPGPSELVLFDPAARFTGDAAGKDASGNAIGVKFDVRYDTRLRPRGSVGVKFSGGSFSGKDPTWIVQVGNVAIIEQVGTLNGARATLRLRVDDNAEPARPDTFRVQLGAFDSATTSVTTGNLQSHPG